MDISFFGNIFISKVTKVGKRSVAELRQGIPLETAVSQNKLKLKTNKAIEKKNKKSTNINFADIDFFDFSSSPPHFLKKQVPQLNKSNGAMILICPETGYMWR